MTDRPDDSEDLRARCYMLLATLLGRPPDEALLTTVRELSGAPGTALGEAAGALGAAAATARASEVAREYNRLFIGLERGEILPYASHYRGDGLFGRPLGALRRDMAGLGVEPSGDVAEPEDHAATVLEIMGGLVLGRFHAAAAPREQAAFFRRHVAPWVPRLFDDLAAAPSAAFYQSVAAFGAAFLEVEAQAFALLEESAS